ncbi:hypothetical protein GAYE_SCF45G5752 [Galdieria yellowstonensis]|uniref:Uncharacterized protein n=1 Tax=Galdieria yellowstonensis TaxID=3028027 RepID=A0AAV9IKT4_9RHOD|nr:hypothetical protein GAYE_SCF45G5752 [Galdieria yellowstonensis]
MHILAPDLVFQYASSHHWNEAFRIILPCGKSVSVLIVKVFCKDADAVNKEVLKIFHDKGVGLIALLCTGFNKVDLKAPSELKIPVVRVPAYSPNAVGEFVVAQSLSLARKIHKAYDRTVGIVGTAWTAVLKSLELELLSQSDIVSLHCPLNENTKYFIRAETLSKMKPGELIRTSRGASMNTQIILNALYLGHIEVLEMDVYYGDLILSKYAIVHDPLLAKLQVLPDVFIASHQAFRVDVSLRSISRTTIENISNFYY